MTACRSAGVREPTRRLWFVVDWQLAIVGLATVCCSVDFTVHWLSISHWLSLGLYWVVTMLLPGAWQNKKSDCGTKYPCCAFFFYNCYHGVSLGQLLTSWGTLLGVFSFVHFSACCYCPAVDVWAPGVAVHTFGWAWLAQSYSLWPVGSKQCSHDKTN